MKFSVSIPNNSKLNTTSERLLWALGQYQAGLIPSPLVAASPSGIPPVTASPLSAGVDPLIVSKYGKPDSVVPFDLTEFANRWEYSVQMLLNATALGKGLALTSCIRETSAYQAQPYNNLLPAGNVIGNLQLPATFSLEAFILYTWSQSTEDRKALTTPFAGLANASTIIDGAAENGQPYKALRLTGSIPKKEDTSLATDPNNANYVLIDLFNAKDYTAFGQTSGS